MTRYCDACGREVGVAGGIANLWVFGGHSKTEGMTLEFDADDSEHFLCFECIEELPDDPDAADVAAIRARKRGEPVDDGTDGTDGADSADGADGPEESTTEGA